MAEYRAGLTPDAATARAAALLKEGGDWIVDDSNYQAAILALGDRNPRFLILRAVREAEHGTLKADTVAAIARTAKNCVMKLELLDTFYSGADDKNTDTERLEHILNNTSLWLTQFWGHLDAVSIARVPWSVRWLGLAIRNEEDAVAVSGMDIQRMRGLFVLDVAVSTRVAPQNLRPLPRTRCLQVQFYGICDGQVDFIRPAIDALVPDKGLEFLCFPKCQLSAYGVQRLAIQLRGAEVHTVHLDPSGLWRPGPEEQTSLTEVFRRSVQNHVVWDMNDLFE